jgi:hypothetical protein
MWRGDVHAATMPLAPANPCDAQRLTPLASYTYLIPLRTQRQSTKSLRLVPPQLPAPVRALPGLPVYTPALYSPASPVLSPSTESLATTGHGHAYLPTRYIITKPSTQSFESQAAYAMSSQNLLSRYPVPGLDSNDGMMMGDRVVHLIESLDSGPVWVGSQVTVTARDDISECARYHEGRLISMCERRRNVTWFVFKDRETKRLHFVEVRNQMVRWPPWHRALSYLHGLCAYLHHRLFGHQLPL